MGIHFFRLITTTPLRYDPQKKNHNSTPTTFNLNTLLHVQYLSRTLAHGVLIIYFGKHVAHTTFN